MRGILLLLCLVFLAGCASRQAAPVIERAPVSKATAKKKIKREGDWRPATHTVKRGETLYAIALEYGLDYRELASWNQLDKNFVIKVGQILRLGPAGQAAVVTTPLASAPVAGGSADRLISEPVAVKLPYSDQALADLQAPARAPEKVPKAVVAEPVKVPESKPAETVVAASTVADNADDDMPEEDQVPWIWPTEGRVVGGFGDKASGKGLDIAGKVGQPVLAAGAGKIVYSGSGLRGYGRLIIIKHNKTYLSAYAHNKTLLVKEGQTVNRGQKIAEMGDSDADGVKLHFEIRRYGKPVDPAKYLPNDANRGI